MSTFNVIDIFFHYYNYFYGSSDKNKKSIDLTLFFFHQLRLFCKCHNQCCVFFQFFKVPEFNFPQKSTIWLTVCLLGKKLSRLLTSRRTEKEREKPDNDSSQIMKPWSPVQMAASPGWRPWTSLLPPSPLTSLLAANWLSCVPDESPNKQQMLVIWPN